MRVAERLAGEGFEAAVLDLRTIAPIDRDSVLRIARHCSRVMIVHEDSKTGGIGESLAAVIQEEAFDSLDAPVRVIGALDTPVPYSPPLEHFFLPGEDEILRARARIPGSAGTDMTRNVDGLTSSTLKHLRERWWDESFTAFLKDTLQPKSGRRILDVGCGTGTAEVNLSRLRLTQVNFVAVDLLPERVAVALAAARATNFRAGFAAADACSLPFPDATFDSTFCVAVLQHITDAPRAVREMARVTRPGGRAARSRT